ncbi:MAG: glycerol-3-phosphate 1-O-acyltransferase PlsY [Marinobacterium sp.]|nr:glycerol-3-phosphate 1-O-acyltransferase PlsY [Marinobacterium sp.]
MAHIDQLTVSLVLLAYLAGSLPSAVLVCHCMGIADPRQQGSGNPGASNVLRIGNRRAAAYTLLGDAGKGLLAVLLARALEQPLEMQGICGLAALLGHIFPVLSMRQGGKGVATGLGVALALSWPLALVQLLCWAVVMAFSRIASLASVTTAALTPALTWLITPSLIGLYSAISLLLLLRHWRNIIRLLQGKESKLSSSSKPR